MSSPVHFLMLSLRVVMFSLILCSHGIAVVQYLLICLCFTFVQTLHPNLFMQRLVLAPVKRHFFHMVDPNESLLNDSAQQSFVVLFKSCIVSLCLILCSPENPAISIANSFCCQLNQTCLLVFLLMRCYTRKTLVL